MSVSIDQDKWNFFLLNYKEYSLGMPFALYFFLIILFFYISNKRNKEKAIFVYPFFLELLTIFNPFIMYVVIQKFGWSALYYRFFWCVPVGIAIAYICTIITEDKKVVGLMFVLIIILSFGHVARLDNISDNIYKIDSEVIEIVEMLREEENEQDICVFYPMDLVWFIRQYDAGVFSPIGRADIIKTPLTDELEQELIESGRILKLMANFSVEVDKEEFLNALQENNVQYYIVKKEWLSQEYLDSLNMDLLGETKNYFVYKI